ncbi:hypothetical protein [Kitasatospora sp. NPDC092286]|uniref:hypothetical protein n=1 Tax=Kitasatospora sp. NPDC092286 TaxID=3364087 RepID=UPI003829D6AA
MNPHSRLAFLGRMLRGLATEPRVTWTWVWGVYLQFWPPVLWVSPRRRRAAREYDRILAQEQYEAEIGREITRSMIRQELDRPVFDPQTTLSLLGVLMDNHPDHPGHRRPRGAWPPDRPV